MNKDKLKKILQGISSPASGVKDQKVVDKLLATFDWLYKLKEELKKSEVDLTISLNQKLDILKSKMAEYRTASLDRLGTLSEEMDRLKEDIREISSKKVEIPDFESHILKVENELGDLVFGLKEYTEETIESTVKEFKKTINNLEEEIKKLRRDTMSVTAGRGGGNMNRNILVGNNPSTLGRYTDLNIKPGTNVTLTYTNNDNLKTTDLTIAATGGSGITRNVSTVIVSSVVAAVASTDYVVIAGAGIQLTLPTAVGNTNLITVKNKAASSVIVIANGAETIDGDANIILATRYVSVDLISDNAAWHIT